VSAASLSVVGVVLLATPRDTVSAAIVRTNAGNRHVTVSIYDRHRHQHHHL